MTTEIAFQIVGLKLLQWTAHVIWFIIPPIFFYGLGMDALNPSDGGPLVFIVAVVAYAAIITGYVLGWNV